MNTHGYEYLGLTSSNQILLRKSNNDEKDNKKFKFLDLENFRNSDIQIIKSQHPPGPTLGPPHSMIKAHTPRKSNNDEKDKKYLGFFT